MAVVERDKQACILLVEDDNALRRLLEVKLQRAGYKVITAADGLEGKKLALSSPIDIVITDTMMPKLSGHEFCSWDDDTGPRRSKPTGANLE